MKRYSREFKDSILTKLLPPNNVGVPQLAAQSGIPRDTLYGWRREALGRPRRPTGIGDGTSGHPRQRGEVRRGGGDGEPQRAGVGCVLPRQRLVRRADQRLARETCRQANAPLASKAERAPRRAEQAEIGRLGRELQRKDRALAEAAALLVLQKKVRAIWEEPEDARGPTNDAFK